MDEDTKIIWERFLNPKPPETDLMVASLFITAFEMLQDSVVVRVKAFFTEDINNGEAVINKKYRTDVLTLDKSPLWASLQWLKQFKAIDDSDIEKLNVINAFRNRLVQDSPVFKTAGGKNDPLLLFAQMPEVPSKIERWWMITVAAQPRLHFNDKKMNEAGIIRDKIMTLRLLAEIASGLGEEFETKMSQNCGYTHNGETFGWLSTIVKNVG